MRTTVNINPGLMEKLLAASRHLDISTNECIAMLIERIVSDNNFEAVMFKSVRYQDADPENEWRTFHVTMSPQLYEKCLDLRKCFKFSVSYLISYAIVNLLEKLIINISTSCTKNNLDNYSYNYIYINKKSNNINEIIIYWGYPGEKTLCNHLP